MSLIPAESAESAECIKREPRHSISTARRGGSTFPFNYWLVGLYTDIKTSSLLAAGATGAVSLHDLSAGGAPPQTAAAAEGGHKFTASSICFYPSDADLFISGSFDGTVRAWDTRELSVAHTFRISRAVHAIAMAPRARHTLIAVAAAAAAVRLLDLGSGAAAQELIGHVGAACYAVAWSTRDENLLASGGVDGQVRLWDVRMARACLVSLDCEGAGRGNVDRRNRAHDGSWFGCMGRGRTGFG